MASFLATSSATRLQPVESTAAFEAPAHAALYASRAPSTASSHGKSSMARFMARQACTGSRLGTLPPCLTR